MEGFLGMRMPLLDKGQHHIQEVGLLAQQVEMSLQADPLHLLVLLDQYLEPQGLPKDMNSLKPQVPLTSQIEGIGKFPFYNDLLKNRFDPSIPSLYPRKILPSF